MDIKDFLILLLANSAVTAILFAAIGFIGKSFIEQWLNRNLEKYKIDIQKKVIYNEKRLEVIDKLYKLIYSYSTSMNATISTLQDYKAKGNSLEGKSFTEMLKVVPHKKRKFPQQWGEAWDYYNQNCLYLSEHLSNKIENILLKALAVQLAIVATSDYENSYVNIPLDLEEVLKLFKGKGTDPLEAAEETHSQFNDVLNDLEKEFRNLMVK